MSDEELHGYNRKPTSLDSQVRKPTKHTLAQINRKLALAQERAQKVAALAETTTVHEKDQLVRTGVKRSTLVSSRMSSKGFGDKDPRHALKILRLLNVDGMEAYTFATLGLTSYKYHVSTLTARLVDASTYPSLRSAAMPAAQAVRYLYEVAMEVGDESTRELLCWNTAQQMIQGRASRGAGIVAANDDAMALLVKALAACVGRIEKRVEAAEQYERDMSATAAGCRV
tara:strand:+ start:56 stop:739 length:684 start_codon:yes stop_codon:yes gene_type:complete